MIPVLVKLYPNYNTKAVRIKQLTFQSVLISRDAQIDTDLKGQHFYIF